MKAFLSLAAVGSSLVAASTIPTTTGSAAPAAVSLTNSSSPQVNAQLNSDPEFDFVLKTFLAQSESGGANTGEILRAASQIKPGDFESFYSEFKYLADYTSGLARSYKCAVSRRDAFFRASTYYRAADFFLHGNQSDPRIYSLWDSELDNFNQGAALLDIPPENINITTPYGFYVPVRFFKAAADHTARPTILIGTGYDGSQEDTYFTMCPQVLARGWNCVTYEGPGQPVVIRQQHKGFIREWWEVVTPVTDYLLKRTDVDGNQMALMGISFGGQLTPLAASREHRYQLIIAIDGLYDLATLVTSQLPANLNQELQQGDKAQFDAAFNELRNNPQTETSFRWFIDQGLFTWNTESAYDWMTSFLTFSVQNHTATIQQPVFVGQGQDDDLSQQEPLQLVKALGSRAHYQLFKTDVGAGEHCQIGAEGQMTAAIFEWAEEVLGQKK